MPKRSFWYYWYNRTPHYVTRRALFYWAIAVAAACTVPYLMRGFRTDGESQVGFRIFAADSNYYAGLGLGLIVMCGLGGFLATEYYMRSVRRWAKAAPRCWKCRYQLAANWTKAAEHLPDACPECGFATSESRDLLDRYEPSLFMGIYRGWKELFVSLYRWYTRRSER